MLLKILALFGSSSIEEYCYSITVLGYNMTPRQHAKLLTKALSFHPSSSLPHPGGAGGDLAPAPLRLNFNVNLGFGVSPSAPWCEGDDDTTVAAVADGTETGGFLGGLRNVLGAGGKAGLGPLFSCLREAGELAAVPEERWWDGGRGVVRNLELWEKVKVPCVCARTISVGGGFGEGWGEEGGDIDTFLVCLHVQ